MLNYKPLKERKRSWEKSFEGNVNDEDDDGIE